MSERPEKTLTDISLVQLLPNILTTAALCAGLSAIRFGVQGNYVLAVQLIVAACILDGVDGRIARLMSTDSEMGAELDSLADLVNFGVAPPLVLYFWALQDLRSAGWIAVLIFAVCCALRLARFNVSSPSDNLESSGDACAYFVGVPSPAAALLVLLPLSISFAFTDASPLPNFVILAHIILVGYLMISRIPVCSFKMARVSRKNAKFILVGFAVVGAAMLTYAWITLILLCLAYFGMIVWCLIMRRPPKRNPAPKTGEVSWISRR